MSLYLHVFIFFLMIRRPPRSTLFPTRRSSDLAVIGIGAAATVLRYVLSLLGLRKYTNSDLRLYLDRKSTRLNSSHANISYAVFCLKKKQSNPALCPSTGPYYPSERTNAP